MAEFDLLIRGGEVIQPQEGARRKLDVAVAGGTVQLLEADIAPERAARVLDANGKLVTPGLIDMHTHLGFELHSQAIQADDVCPQSGVTTAVDMGSTGAFTFPWYSTHALATSTTRLIPFLNIASLGTIAIHSPYYVERYGQYIDENETARTIQENADRIGGIKVFASGKMVGCWALDSVRAAVRVGDRCDVPVAVHVSDAPPPLDGILACLRPGDILTHTFTPHNQGILNEQGRIKASVWDARRRGVLFDLGHGAGSFSFEVARCALAQGFVPDTLSTDIYYANVNGPVFDLVTTLSKLLALGLDVEEVITRSTANAARALRRPDLGVLEIGTTADIAVLALEEGEHTFTDVLQQTLVGSRRLRCLWTVSAGRVIYEGAQ
ncbi:MAG: amidohydrolase/deacetylase family metallohydrolase [Anaerolineae bacterium]